MKNQRRNGKADSVLVLLLFGVFAVCILSVLLLGADAYHRLAERDQGSYDQRTAAQYLTTRVRQADLLGNVAVERFGDVDALVLGEETEGFRYETLVYCHDGYLRELFVAADGGGEPQDGEKILAAEALALEQEGQTLTAELTGADGDAQTLILYLRSERGIP